MYLSTLVGISFLICVVADKASDKNKDDYISQESEDLTEMNEVINSSSKENNDEQTTRGLIKNVTVTTTPLTPEKINVTMIPQQIENLTANSLKCVSKKTSSSEEDRCRSTLVNYPYSASIQKKGAHYASGALINKQSVLTAAGGFYHVREAIKLFRVRLGSVDCKRGGVLLPIKRVEIHPSYEYGKPTLDLALVKLGHPVQLSDYIRPIAISRVRQGVISAKFLTTYWPRLIIKGRVLPQTAKERVKQNSMRVSTQRLIPWKTCAALMRARDSKLDETSLCLKPLVTHHSTCMPDVGAPVVAEDGVWGITSGWTSKHCHIYPSPTIFTRTAMPPVRTWLESVL